MRGDPDNRGDLLGPPKSFQPPATPPRAGERNQWTGGQAPAKGGASCALLALVGLGIAVAIVGALMAIGMSSTPTLNGAAASANAADAAANVAAEPADPAEAAANAVADTARNAALSASRAARPTVDHGNGGPRNAYKR